MFAGKWMRHGGWYPGWQLRLFRRGTVRYESRLVHAHAVLDGNAGYLSNDLLHHDFKGMERYFDRHNAYSSMEAVEAYRALRNPEKLLRPDPSFRFFERAGAPPPLEIAGIPTILPFRSLFKFLWLYIFRVGFLDGRIGFRFCLLHTFYEYQVSLKLEELDDPDSPLRRKYRDYIGG